VVSSAGVPPLIGTAARRRRALAHLSPIFDLHLYRARNPSDVDWIFEPRPTCSNALRRVQHPAFSLVADELAVCRADAAAIGYRHRRCTLMGPDVQVIFIGITTIYRRLTAERQLAPLAQSVERIHGKENPGPILLVR
jgi:hypothetical protein